MEKFELFKTFVSNGHKPDLDELEKIFKWVNDDDTLGGPSREDVLRQFIAGGNAPTLDDLKKMWRWLKNGEDGLIARPPYGHSITDFVKNVTELNAKYNNYKPHIPTRVANWATVSGRFNSVDDIIKYGSKRALNDSNIGKVCVDYISDCLKEYYNVETW